MRPIRQATAGVALTLALAGCASTSTPTATRTDSPPANDMPGMPGMPAAPSAPGAPVAADTVAIRNFGFSPAAVTVRVGATVTWTNSDEEPHTVVATGGGPKSQTLGSGGRYRYTFTAPGTVNYLCSIHPFMRGTVTVTP